MMLFFKYIIQDLYQENLFIKKMVEIKDENMITLWKMKKKKSNGLEENRKGKSRIIFESQGAK